jgi:secreted trypsin-like serine protease
MVRGFVSLHAFYRRNQISYGVRTFSSTDVMLIKLSTPSTAPLQQVNFDPNFPPVGSPVTVIGYGLTSEGGTAASPILLQTENNVLSYDDCQAYYGTIIEERMICMGDSAGGRDACQGDSGGPMLFNNVQVGIVR